MPIESTALPLTITYMRNGGTVRGTVEGCNGGTVLLIPQTLVLRRDGFIRQTKCEETGRFEVLNVRPGEYYRFAVAPEIQPVGQERLWTRA